MCALEIAALEIQGNGDSGTPVSVSPGGSPGGGGYAGEGVTRSGVVPYQWRSKRRRWTPYGGDPQVQCEADSRRCIWLSTLAMVRAYRIVPAQAGNCDAG